MKFWWMFNFRRLALEKAAVESLAEEYGWFELTGWSINKFRLSAEGIITAHGKPYPIRLLYPDHFPHVPGWVEPQEQLTNWSGHQYPNGVLCLELRPDNWSPSATGADLLRSAYSLLYSENPLGEGVRECVPSAHRIGDMQSYDWREQPILIGEGCLDRLKRGKSKDLSALRWRPIDRFAPIMVLDEEDRASGYYPSSMEAGLLINDLSVEVVHSEFSEANIEPDNQQTLATALGNPESPPLVNGLLGLFVGTEDVTPYHSPEPNSVLKGKLVIIPEELGQRSGRKVSATAKRVAIIGLGSVGSKVAEMLIRSGIHDLLLVDGDVMLPGNLERHCLDWRDVGFRKAEAVKRRLQYISPGASVNVITENLDWQRSADVHEGQINIVSQSDLIIDATGDIPTSLLLGAIAVKNSKAFLSATVFEGGLGCLIARCLPNLDPPYAQCYDAFIQFCDEADIEPPRSGHLDYESTSEAGEPILADDAAISITAAHMACVALGILEDEVNVDDTNYALLLLGFRAGWLFKHHGDSIALDVGRPQAAEDEFDPKGREFASRLAKELLYENKASG